ncbi:MAG: hypothetical protein OEU93_06385 [Rubrivivax sp.]|nr:hypothetical protein [Rubrivivax sp.]MDH5340622.1 hypothetical protein [Rubrivivax sp.]
MSAVVLKVLWIYGLAAVVSMLIAGIIKLIVVILGRLERPPAPQPMRAPAQAAPAAGMPAEHLAAIAAAAQACLGAHRIVHIEDTRSTGRWGAEGRTAQHHSHTVPAHRPKH